jgi:hypothetical protein
VTTAPLHLKLVISQEEAPSVKTERRSSQLAFPFPERRSLVLADLSNFESGKFLERLVEIQPKWIFDIRAVPRFDNVARSRQYAFQCFEDVGARYIDVFGRLGISSYKSVEANPLIWAKSIPSFMDSAEPDGPFLFLFDEQGILKLAHDRLGHHFSGLLGPGLSISYLAS